MQINKFDAKLARVRNGYVFDRDTLKVFQRDMVQFILLYVHQFSLYSQSMLKLCYRTRNEEFYIEKREGIIVIPLSDNIDNLEQIEVLGLKLRDECSLLSQENYSRSGNSIVISPHPDDAELSSFFYYSKRCESSYIVNLTAGEYLSRLESQYITGLCDNLQEAMNLKGIVRLWNGLNIPAFGGVPLSRVASLGYKDGGLELDRKSCHPPNYNYRHIADGFMAYNAEPASIVNDLSLILSSIKPVVVIVPNPFIDRHPDHVTSAILLAEAMAISGFYPDKVFLYAIHQGCDGVVHSYEQSKYISGKEFTVMKNIFHNGFSMYSESSNELEHKMKIIALDAMHDLRHKEKLFRKIKVCISDFLRVRRKIKKHPHDLVNVFGKKNETFMVVDGHDFYSAVQRLINDKK